MPAGELLLIEVAKVLSVHEAKTVNEIVASLPFIVSERAVRYAVQGLVDTGRAKRIGPKIIKPGNKQHYKVLAVPDGIALTSIEHPPGLIDQMADAIRSGKLR